MHDARDHLLAGAALAGDEEGHVGVLHAVDERVQPPHRCARSNQARVSEVTPQLGTHLLQVAPRLGELLGALAERARQLVAGARQLDVGPRASWSARTRFSESRRAFSIAIAA